MRKENAITLPKRTFRKLPPHLKLSLSPLALRWLQTTKGQKLLNHITRTSNYGRALPLQRPRRRFKRPTLVTISNLWKIKMSNKLLQVLDGSPSLSVSDSSKTKLRLITYRFLPNSVTPDALLALYNSKYPIPETSDLVLASPYQTSRVPNLPLLNLLTRTSVQVNRKAHTYHPFAVLSFYLTFLAFPIIETYLQAQKAKTIAIIHFLHFRFRGSKFTLTLQDKLLRKTHLHIVPGFFIKYFQSRKALKRSRSLKLLMVKFFRKILLVLDLPMVALRIRGIPALLELMLTNLFKPAAHPILNPLTGTILDETQPMTSRLRIGSITFETSKPFGYLKPKKKGRVKRKIRRKITSLNNVID